ncbi:unnamed protein product [Polarella glacialis]|uniref:Uncharacterized protein n=2 Tax=Polarella glacialis TaxID=89957 RepID=A0A813EH69_POLGL|nr:unnamed protein product [Polarella glacialis]
MAGSGLALESGKHGAETRVSEPRAFAFSKAARASTDPSCDAFCQIEDSINHLPALGPVVTGRMMTDPAISGARTGIVVMPELDFAALVPNMPGMLMESPSRGRGKNTVRFNLLPEIHAIWNDRSPDVGVVGEVSEPFDPPGHLFLRKEIEPRSVFSTVEMMLRARKLLRRARSTFHSTRPSQNAASVLR